MFTLIKCEIKKLLVKRKTKIILCLMVISYIVLLIGTINKMNNMGIDSQISRVKKQIVLAEQLVPKMSNDDDRKQYEKDLDNLKYRLDNLQKEKQIESSGWKALISFENTEMKDQIEKLPPSEFNQKVLLNSAIRNNEKCLSEDRNPNGRGLISPIKVIINVTMIFSMIIISLLIAFLASDIVSGELSPPTIRIWLTKPISRKSIILSKYIALIVTILITLLSLEFISWLILSIMYGLDDFNIPITVGASYHWEDGVLKIIENSVGSGKLWWLILFEFLFQILIISAWTALILLISTFTKRGTISIILSICIVGILQYLPMVFINSFGLLHNTIMKISPLLISTYTDFVNLFSGTIAEKYNNPLVSPISGLFLLISLSFTFIIVSIKVFEKKDIAV